MRKVSRNTPHYTSMKLSIILVSYNSREDLARCLPTIVGQEEGVEILVVDNSPGDDTRAWLVATYPEVRLIANSENSGYAGGNNLGIEHATGEWVLILNPDTQVHPGALTALLSAAKQHDRALLTPKLLKLNGKVNACGLEMHYTGITSCRGLGDDSGKYTGTFPAQAVSGAAFLAPKWLLIDLDGFETSYFMYQEDADLSLRARAKGYEIYCVADAVVTHAYSTDMSVNKFYLLERNRLLTLFRLYQSRTLFRLAGALLLTELAVLAFALLKGPSYLARKGSGYIWLWRKRRDWLTGRRAFQQWRTMPDDDLLRGGTVVLPFDQLVSSRARADLLTRATKPVYNLLRPRTAFKRARE